MCVCAAIFASFLFLRNFFFLKIFFFCSQTVSSCVVERTTRTLFKEITTNTLKYTDSLQGGDYVFAYIHFIVSYSVCVRGGGEGAGGDGIRLKEN